MSWLVWREYRSNRLILIAGAVLLILPYLFALVVVLWPTKVFDHLSDMRELFGGSAVYSFGLSQLTVVLLGGNAFAAERVDRSGEFLAYLPLSRARRLGSKLILAVIAIAILCGINLFVLWGLERLPGRANYLYSGLTKYPAITGFVMFGVAWLISSFRSSPTIAVCGGMATPLCTIIGLWIVQETHKLYDDQFVLMWYSAISVVFGLAGFAFGTWYFLKQAEP